MPDLSPLLEHWRYPAIFLVVILGNVGLPVPEESVLALAGFLAARGLLHLPGVLAVGALAAIVGDNLGYWLIGRLGGRALFRRWSWLNRWADTVIPRAEKIMKRHGGKTVFFGRFVAILRFTAAWVAGLGEMPWWRFLFWNATGGIVWATAVGLVAFYGGKSAADAITHYGLLAAVGIVALVVLGAVVLHFAKKRLESKL
jgi:membrane protein DedA with SNARE-associated domain